jgi:hypothetical protein
MVRCEWGATTASMAESDSASAWLSSIVLAKSRALITLGPSLLGGAGNGLFHMNRPDDVVLSLTYYVVSALIGTYERFSL